METNAVARRANALLRAWIPASAALLAAGGGTGAYWYLSPADSATHDRTITRSAPTAADELKQLFAETQPAASLEQDAEQLFAAPVEESVKSFASPAASTLGDRYATYPTPEIPVPGEPEITRGQGPDANPLRSSSTPSQSSIAYDDSAARAAFGDTPPAAGNPLDVALEQAQPLAAEQPSYPTAAPPQPTPAATSNNPFAAAPASQAYASPTGSPPAGYASAPAEQAYPADARYAEEPTSNLPATMDLRTADAGLTSAPTPAFAMDGPQSSASTNSLPQSTIATQVPISAQAPLSTPTANLDSANTGFTPTPGLVNQPGTGRPGEKLLEGTQSPSLTIQKLAPPEIQVGKRCTFAIRVQNTGQRTAQNVQIHDEIPLGTELVGTVPRAAVTGSKVVWDMGTLSVGEQRTVEMELIPSEEGELGSVATVTLAAQASARARCTKPELALRLSSQPQVHIGQQQLVQIEVSNPGSGEATNIMLLETVPAGVTHEAGPALEFELGNLAPGESRKLELLLSAEQAGRIQNTMTARADAGLQVEASCEFEIIAPELRLAVEGPDRRFLERPATYQVSVDNPGTAPAKEVQLVTHLPKGLQFVSANNLGEYDAAAHSVYWSLAELPANERGMVELVALPVEPGEHKLEVSTQARDGLADQIQKSVTVEGIAAIMFEVVDREDPIEVGGETSYEIRVTNQGSKAAGNVQVVAIMPPGLRALSGQGNTQNTVQGDRVIFAPIPQLGPKSEATFRIQAQGIQAGDQRMHVQITTDEIRDPITKEESTRVYSDH